MLDNKASYEQKYAIGYGIKHPDGHIIRIYKQILEYQLKLKSGRVLDFGTGNGIHLAWLKEQGDWDVYGTDISELALEMAKKNLPKDVSKLVLTKDYPDLKTTFNTKFDLIIANQVLYYVDNKELNYLITQFHDILNPGGVIIATMMGIENFYYSKSTEVVGSDLRKVTLTGRLNETSHINFKTREQVASDFSCFKKLHVGYYDATIREDEGSTMHHFFVGQKV